MILALNFSTPQQSFFIPYFCFLYIDIICAQAKIDKNVTEIIKIIEIWMKPAPLLHLQKVWLNSLLLNNWISNIPYSYRSELQQHTCMSVTLLPSGMFWSGSLVHPWPKVEHTDWPEDSKKKDKILSKLNLQFLSHYVLQTTLRPCQRTDVLRPFVRSLFRRWWRSLRSRTWRWGWLRWIHCIRHDP